MNLAEAVEHARDTVFVPQRGESCHASGGMQFDQHCPAFSAGLDRRRTAQMRFERNKIFEAIIPERGVVRVSHIPNSRDILIEHGEYIGDTNFLPAFSVFQRWILPTDIFECVRT